MENWETRELGCPPIKGNLTASEATKVKSRIVKQNQDNYFKNMNDKELTKDLYKNNFYATTTQINNDSNFLMAKPTKDRIEKIYESMGPE